MNLKVTISIVVLGAAINLSALGVAPAMGEGEEFHWHDGESIVLTDTNGGSGVQTFAFDEGAPLVFCGGLEVEGRAFGLGEGPFTSEELTVGVGFVDCSMVVEEIELEAELRGEGCHFALSSETDESEYAAIELLGCEFNGGIAWTGPYDASVLIPHQVIESAVHFENTGETGGEGTVDVAIASDAIQYQCGPFYLCIGSGFFKTEGMIEFEGGFELGGFAGGGETGDYSHGTSRSISHW